MNIRQIHGDYYPLQMTPKIQAHFDEPTNYAHFIVAEWQTLPYSYIKPKSTILDIGANIGLFALHVFPYANKIICVEPTPSHMEIQKEVLQGVFPFECNIQHDQVALHNYTGKVGFHLEGVNSTMNRVNVNNIGSIEVDCITLEDLCKKWKLDHVDFCKIDIEGSEDSAITVETVMPVKDIIKCFSIELHPRTKEMQDKYIAIFEACGYKTEAIDFNGTVTATR